MPPHRILKTIDFYKQRQDLGVDIVNDLWTQFGAAVRAERKRKNIPSEKFARALSYTPAMINLLETGKRAWPLTKARKAVEVLR